MLTVSFHPFPCAARKTREEQFETAADEFPSLDYIITVCTWRVTRYILDASVRAGSGYARGEIVKLRERSDARDRLCVTLELRVSGRSFGSPRIYSVIINAAR